MLVIHLNAQLTLDRKCIVWQDSLLSLAFDRPIECYDMDYEEDLQNLTAAASSSHGLHYCQAMNWICHVTLRHYSRQPDARVIPNCMSLFQDMKLIEAALSPHLKDRELCTTLQQVQEFYAFTVHKNFVIATICRPVISGISSSSLESSDDKYVLDRLQLALKHSAKAYVRLRPVACYGRRSWALIHNGLTSVLLLSLMKETRNAADTRELQNELIASLSEAEAGLGIDSSSSSISQLSSTHRKALKAIQNLKLLSEHETSSKNCQGLTPDSGFVDNRLPNTGQSQEQTPADYPDQPE